MALTTSLCYAASDLDFLFSLPYDFGLRCLCGPFGAYVGLYALVTSGKQ